MTRLGAMLRRDLPPEDLAAIASAAAPGLDELWIVEDLNWPGGIAQMSAVLDATDNDAAGRPVVGHGIAPPPFATLRRWPWSGQRWLAVIPAA